MWEEYFGQTQLKQELLNLKDYPVSLLLRGNSGYGKTTLANLYASARGNYDYQLASDLVTCSLNSATNALRESTAHATVGL
jgi:Holliday junction resolvasome RuvABC ATP-dependent DNA helicase subunit